MENLKNKKKNVVTKKFTTRAQPIIKKHLKYKVVEKDFKKIFGDWKNE